MYLELQSSASDVRASALSAFPRNMKHGNNNGNNNGYTYKPESTNSPNKQDIMK